MPLQNYLLGIKNLKMVIWDIIWRPRKADGCGQWRARRQASRQCQTTEWSQAAAARRTLSSWNGDSEDQRREQDLAGGRRRRWPWRTKDADGIGTVSGRIQLARASAGPGVLTRKAALSHQTGGTRTAGKGEGTDRVPGRPQGAVGRERVPAARPGSRCPPASSTSE